MMRAYPKHCAPIGYCMNGVRDYWISHGWDYADFVQNGIDTQILRNTNDLLAIRLAEFAEEHQEVN